MAFESISAKEYARQFLYIAQAHRMAGRVRSYDIALNIAAGHMVDAVVGDSYIPHTYFSPISDNTK